MSVYQLFFTDELVLMRAISRASDLPGRFQHCDNIRAELLRRNVIVTDTPEGQEVTYLAHTTTVQRYRERMAKDKRAEARFNAWLFSMQQHVVKQ